MENGRSPGAEGWRTAVLPRAGVVWQGVGGGERPFSRGRGWPGAHSKFPTARREFPGGLSRRGAPSTAIPGTEGNTWGTMSAPKHRRKARLADPTDPLTTTRGPFLGVKSGPVRTPRPRGHGPSAPGTLGAQPGGPGSRGRTLSCGPTRPARTGKGHTSAPLGGHPRGNPYRRGGGGQHRLAALRHHSRVRLGTWDPMSAPKPRRIARVADPTGVLTPSPNSLMGPESGPACTPRPRGHGPYLPTRGREPLGSQKGWPPYMGALVPGAPGGKLQKHVFA